MNRLPAKHRWVRLKPATGKIETVPAGGENYLGCRPLHHEFARIEVAPDAYIEQAYSI